MPLKQQFIYTITYTPKDSEVNFTFPLKSTTLNQASIEVLKQLQPLLGVGRLSSRYIAKTAIGNEPASDQIKSKEVRDMFRRTLPSKERSSTTYGEFTVHKYTDNSLVGKLTIKKLSEATIESKITIADLALIKEGEKCRL